MNDTNNTKANDVRLVFEEGLVKQVTETLETALRERGITQRFRFEVGDWHLDAEIVWHTTGQEPLRQVWKGWALFRMHVEEPARVLPLLVVVNEGEATFPNLEQLAEAILQTG